MDKERFLSSGLLEQYVLGLTSPEENEEVERYLEAFPELQAEIDAMRHALEQYAMEQSVPPPSHLKSKILSDIEDQASPKSQKDFANRPRAGVSTWLFTTAVIAALFFAGLSTYLYRQQIQNGKQFNQLRSEYAMFKEECQEEIQRSEEMRELYAFLQDPTTQPVALQGTQAAPQAKAIVYWNEDHHHAFFNQVNLPRPPKGHQYQIWADVEGEMISIGLLDWQPGQLQSIDFIEDAESLNITLEPEGGSEKPTVARLFVNGKV